MPAFLSGLIKLINDLTLWALFIVPAIATLGFIYLNSRKSIATEEERPAFDKKIRTLIVCAAIAEGASGLITFILGYF